MTERASPETGTFIIPPALSAGNKHSWLSNYTHRFDLQANGVMQIFFVYTIVIYTILLLAIKFINLFLNCIISI